MTCYSGLSIVVTVRSLCGSGLLSRTARCDNESGRLRLIPRAFAEAKLVVPASSAKSARSLARVTFSVDRASPTARPGRLAVKEIDPKGSSGCLFRSGVLLDRPLGARHCGVFRTKRKLTSLARPTIAQAAVAPAGGTGGPVLAVGNGGARKLTGLQGINRRPLVVALAEPLVGISSRIFRSSSARPTVLSVANRDPGLLTY